MTLYPEQLRTILAYVDALNAAEKVIDGAVGFDTGVYLEITVTLDGDVLGKIVDEIGAAWAFEPAKPG